MFTLRRLATLFCCAAAAACSLGAAAQTAAPWAKTSVSNLFVSFIDLHGTVPVPPGPRLAADSRYDVAITGLGDGANDVVRSDTFLDQTPATAMFGDAVATAFGTPNSLQASVTGLLTPGRLEASGGSLFIDQLAPHTRLYVSGELVLDGHCFASCAELSAASSIDLFVSYAGGPQTQVGGNGASFSNVNGQAGLDENASLFVLTFDNISDTPADVTGTLRVFTTMTVSAVDDTGTALSLTLGLAALAWRWRQRAI